MKKFKVYANSMSSQISKSDMEVLDELCDSIIYQENEYCNGEGYDLVDLQETVLDHVSNAFNDMPEEYPESLVQSYSNSFNTFKNAVYTCVSNHYDDYDWFW